MLGQPGLHLLPLVYAQIIEYQMNGSDVSRKLRVEVFQKANKLRLTLALKGLSPNYASAGITHLQTG